MTYYLLEAIETNRDYSILPNSSLYETHIGAVYGQIMVTERSKLENF